MRNISILIIGGGARCTIYSRLLKKMGSNASVVGVAEPRDFFRSRIADEHSIPGEHVFSNWEEAAKLPRFADAVIIGTQDRMHVEPAESFARLGYHIMIEKPLAPDVEGCKRIVRAAKENKIIFSVCHVLRYANYSTMIRKVIDTGEIGEILSIQHLEPVGHWRFAHSYVRGNWNREENSSSFLLAKSIHDLDWISSVIKKPCTSVSSYGSLMFFTGKNMPEGAAPRCLDCRINSKCAYAAPRFYLERLKTGQINSYLEAVTGNLSEEAVLDAMRNGPYGRCVFDCDNDVADHQVVNMEFEGGATASFSLVGCSQFGDRKSVIFGSKGQISCDGKTILVHNYLRGSSDEIIIEPDNGSLESYHGGGDKACIEAFVEAVAENDQSKILSNAMVSLETHLMVFAAEISRKEKRTVEMSELFKG